MIRVDSSFYESGCTMEGKGNRIFLKGVDKDVEIEMVFVGNTVKISGWYIPAVFDFGEIEKISAISGTKGAVPNIELKY